MRACMPNKLLQGKLLLLLVSLGSLAGATCPAADFDVNEKSLFTLSSRLKLITPTPHLVSDAIAALCTSPSPDLIAKEAARTGPHTGTLVNIYVSEGAAKFMDSSRRRFPEGSMILKEKLSPDGNVAAVGGMIKRAPGFDRSHHDWEYFYAQKDRKMSKGLLRDCIACHAKVESTDYVYTLEKPD
jgi:hypothetical protein